MAEQSTINPPPNPVSPVFNPDDWNLTSPPTTAGNYDMPIIVGEIIMVARTTLPSDDWLWCDGSILSPLTYPELFDAIGYNYGSSGTDFFIPRLTGIDSSPGSTAKGRTLVGADNTSIMRTLYYPSGNAPISTTGVGTRKIPSSGIKSHRHDFTHTHDFSYTYTVYTANNGNTINAISGGSFPVLQNVATTSNIITTNATTANNLFDSGFSGGAEDFISPFTILNFCIRLRA